jgi:hypothetical protein
MRFEVLMAVRMTILLLFWVLTPCRLVVNFSPEDGEIMFLQNTGIYP